MKLTFWGTRGSYPIIGSNDDSVIKSQHTSCVEISSEENNEVLFLDAGTGFSLGIRSFLKKNTSKKVSLLLSHFHWDHLWGLLSIYDLIVKGVSIKIYSPLPNTKEVVMNIFNTSYCPLGKELIEKTFEFEQIDSYSEILGMEVHSYSVPHVGQTFAFQVRHDSKSLFYASDFEIGKSSVDNFKQLKAPDLFICDTFHLDEDKKNRGSLGHSSVTEAITFSKKIQASSLAFFHYSPLYGTKELLQMQSLAADEKEIKVFLSQDNLVVNV